MNTGASKKLIKDLQVPYLDISEFIELAKCGIDLSNGHQGNIENVKIIVVRNCMYYAKSIRRLTGAKCLEEAYKEYGNYFLGMFPEFCEIDF